MRTRRIELIAAPTSMQPGGYVPKAYADRAAASTPGAELAVDSSNGFVVTLQWKCPQPVPDASADPRLFVDACALLVPEKPDSPWITMGAPAAPVQGVLWRADRPAPYRIGAAGLGSVQRHDAPADWTAKAAWSGGIWRVVFTLPQWPALATQRQFAVAIWQGARGDRAGLKSVSPGWMPL